MKPTYAILLIVLLIAGCDSRNQPAPQPALTWPPGTSAEKPATLVEARSGFKSKLVRRKEDKKPVEEPPTRVFRMVKYDSPVGKLAAYLTPGPKDGKKYPAIIWITGGDCNSIGDVWTEQEPSNDQSACAYRKAGIVMMFPSLRGGNDNPGQKEGFLGEVDDVLAAADYLAKQDHVDPARIYLGGHSTGGTLVLLVAECSNRFRAVFSFGPVVDVSGYNGKYLPFDMLNNREVEVRSPGYWLDSIKSPVFVFEGATRDANQDSLRAMSQSNKNSNVHFYAIPGATHFTVLAPTNRLIATKILRDDGRTTNLAFTEDELFQPFAK